MTEELVSAHKTQLILTTSTDPKHPASNILDGYEKIHFLTVQKGRNVLDDDWNVPARVNVSIREEC
jgi:hypothetical protein